MVYNHGRILYETKGLGLLGAATAGDSGLRAADRIAGGNSGATASAASAAQEQPQPEPGGASIKVEVNEVIVPVTVTDDKGRFVSNLEKKDFEILDEGKPQNIRFFARAQPAGGSGLPDRSQQFQPCAVENFQTAATELVLTLLPGKDKFSGYLIGYGNKAELMVNTTSDAEPFVSKIRDLKPGVAEPRCSTPFTWPAPTAR